MKKLTMCLLFVAFQATSPYCFCASQNIEQEDHYFVLVYKNQDKYEASYVLAPKPYQTTKQNAKDEYCLYADSEVFKNSVQQAIQNIPQASDMHCIVFRNYEGIRVRDARKWYQIEDLSDITDPERVCLYEKSYLEAFHADPNTPYGGKEKIYDGYKLMITDIQRKFISKDGDFLISNSYTSYASTLHKELLYPAYQKLQGTAVNVNNPIPNQPLAPLQPVGNHTGSLEENNQNLQKNWMSVVTVLAGGSLIMFIGIVLTKKSKNHKRKNECAEV